MGNQGVLQNYNFGNQGYDSGNAGQSYIRDGQYERPGDQRNWQNKDGYRNGHNDVYVPLGNRHRACYSSSGFKLEDTMSMVKSNGVVLKEMRSDFSSMSQFVKK